MCHQTDRLSHLERLEAESIHIMREVVAEAEKPVMLYSIGKDSAVMLDLAMRAFAPAKPPFPLLHVDTTWKFRDMYELRDRLPVELGVELLVHVNEEGLRQGINPFDHGSEVHTNVMKTDALKQALDEHGFDVAFGGARRDEERSRAKERIFSFRTAQHAWDPKNQRPELWRLFNARKRKGESIRVFPLSNWTELDVWLYIYRHEIPIVPLYLAAERPVVQRDGTLIMVDDDRFRFLDGEEPQTRKMLLAAHERKSLLRFLMCGSVDDGKSTLIGRLLYESQALYADQLAALEDDSRRAGTQEGELDFALLTDGLAAEREQGITIDVAYRHFSTERRHFIVADAPGHEQYTRNMVTGASTADCAVILIDARLGVSRQTRRHSYLVTLLGIEHVVVAVNKMDTVDYSAERFDEIQRAYADVMTRIEFSGEATCIPVSALRGANVLERSAETPWYQGPTLMQYLESVEVERSAIASPFRMPVQWVNRASPDFRGFAGTIVSGMVAPGDEIVSAPSGASSRIKRIVGPDGDLDRAIAGQAVTLTLADHLDCSRGDVIAMPADPPTISDLLQATIVWMHEEPMLRGRNYLMRIGSATVGATVSPLKYKLNVDSLEHVAATQLELNEIGRCDLELSTPVAFDPYRSNRDTGAFILIDRITNETVGAGLIEFALRRSQNIRWQTVTVDRAARASALSQIPCVLWLTGLSGAGKTTIANLAEAELHRRGHHTYLLDGDNVRHGLNRDLGFTDADRVENIRRVAEVSRLMLDAGLIVIVSFISPFRSERQMARRLFDEGHFLEVFVDTPLAVAEERDTKGLYRKARSGELANFTGIDSPYQPPQDPEIRLDTTSQTVDESVAAVLDALEERGLVPPIRQQPRR